MFEFITMYYNLLDFLSYTFVYYPVLHYVAVNFNVLHCITRYCSMFQFISISYIALHVLLCISDH